MNVCENCGIEHDGKYGSGRFCSVKCSRGFSTKHKRKEINEKVSAKSKRLDVIKKCMFCNNDFIIKYSKRKQKYCSRSCSSSANGWKQISSKDWSAIHKNAYKKGTNYVAGGTTKWFNIETSNGKIKVQGTYEVRTSKILDSWKNDGKIKDWLYTSDRVQYIGFDNKSHSYLLDFKIFENDGSFYYLEVKGWEKPNDKLKWNAVKDKLVIWFIDDIIKHEKDIMSSGLALM